MDQKNPFKVSENAGATPRGSDTPALPAIKNGGQPANIAVKAGGEGGARLSVPLFGGHRGGKKRKDGLKPGSPEAIEADRKKDAERKKLERAEARSLRDDEPLPAASSPGLFNPPPPIAPLAGMPGIAIPPQSVAPQWAAKDVEKIVRQFVELTEELATRSITSRCNKARLPADIVREIESDARWSKAAKDMINEGGSELAARYLNSSGISPELKPFLLMAIGAMEIGINHMKILKRLDTLIASQRQP